MTAVDHAARIAEEAARDGWENIDGAALLGAVVDAAAWHLIEATSDTSHEASSIDVALRVVHRDGTFRALTTPQPTFASAKATAARLIGVLPEAEVTEEWGVRWPDGGITIANREETAHRWVAKYPSLTLIHHFRIRRYAEHVTEWEAVD